MTSCLLFGTQSSSEKGFILKRKNLLQREANVFPLELTLLPK